MGMARRLGMVVVAALALCRPAHADPTGEEQQQTTTRVVTLPNPETVQWPARFMDARQELLDGEWERAKKDFDALAASAPTPEDARAAREMSGLAAYWQQRDVAFVPRQSLGESTLSSKAVGRRTVDELVTLYATSAFYGAGVGLSLAAIANANDLAAFVVPAIVGAGAGIGGVALVDNFGRIKYGQAQAVASGTLLGLGDALLFDFWHLAWSQDDCGGTCVRQQWDGRAYVGVGLATTTLGAVVGGLLGTYLPNTPGRASWVSSMGIWSGAIVASITGAIGASSLKQDVLIPTLVGYNAGIVGGILTAGLVSPSIGRVRLLDLGGIVGGLAAFGIYAAAVNNGTMDANVALGVTGLGIAAGLTTSWLLTMKMTPDRPVAADEKPKPAAFDVHPILGPLPGGATAGLAGTF